MPQSDNPDAWLAVINGNNNNNNEVANDQRGPEQPLDSRQQYQTQENINRRVDQQQYPAQENQLTGPPPPQPYQPPPPGSYRGGAPPPPPQLPKPQAQVKHRPLQNRNRPFMRFFGLFFETPMG